MAGLSSGLRERDVVVVVNVVDVDIVVVDIVLAASEDPVVQDREAFINHVEKYKAVKACFGHLSTFQVVREGEGIGCSTAVDHSSGDQEFVGSNTVGCWAFFASLQYSISQ